MQRLACVTFARRLGGLTAMSAAACQTSVRFGHDGYVNKVAKKKVDDGDDERWLEAELDENINTPEERYARSREIERLKKLVQSLDEKHSENLEEAVRQRKSEVELLKEQVTKMQSKIEELSRRDK